MVQRGVGNLEYNKCLAASTAGFRRANGPPGPPLRSLPKDGFVGIEKQHRRGGAFDEFTAGLDLQLR